MVADFGAILTSPGGAPIFLQSDREIRWRFRFGGGAPDQVICVSESVDRELQSADSVGPWTLKILGPDREEEDLHPNTIQINHIWRVMRGRALGGNKVLWHFADRRRALRSAYVDTFFNQMKVSNDFRRPISETLDPNVSILSKAPLNHFIPYTCQETSTINSAEPGAADLYMGAFAIEGSGDYQPWTALRALGWLLSDFGWLGLYNRDREDRGEGKLNDLDGNPFRFINPGSAQVIYTERVVDRKVILRNWNPRKSWPAAVNELCAMARVGLYVNADGDFVVDDLEPIPGIFDYYGRYQGAGGVPVDTTISKTAPRSVRIHYPEFQEIRWEYDEKWAAEKYDGKDFEDVLVDKTTMDVTSGTRFMLENVLPLPQDIDTGSTVIKAGTWVNVFLALKLWRDQAKKKSEVYGNKRSIYKADPSEIFTYEAVLKYSTSVALAHLWQRDWDRPEFKNQIIEARVAAIYQHFRKTFRIPQIWLDHIESVRAELGTIYAYVSRSREPSPVYVDYNAWDSTLYRHSNAGGRGKGFLRNVPIDGDESFSNLDKYAAEGIELFNKATRDFLPFEGDASSKSSWDIRIDQGSPGSPLRPASPTTVSMMDAQRGVFGINFAFDFSGVIIQLRPGLADPRSVPFKSVAGLGSNICFQGQLVFSKTFRLITILSIKWRTRNSAGRHFTISNSFDQKPVSEGGQMAEVGALYLPPPTAEGPDLDIYSPSFEAFRSWQHGKVSWRKDREYNQLTIDHGGDVANLDVLEELSGSMFERAYFRHRDLVLGTYRAPLWTGQFPVGNIRETSIVLSPTGVLETELSGERLPALPSIWEFMSNSTRNVLARFEADTTGGDQ